MLGFEDYSFAAILLGQSYVLVLLVLVVCVAAPATSYWLAIDWYLVLIDLVRRFLRMLRLRVFLIVIYEDAGAKCRANMAWVTYLFHFALSWLFVSLLLSMVVRVWWRRLILVDAAYDNASQRWVGILVATWVQSLGWPKSLVLQVGLIIKSSLSRLDIIMLLQLARH